MFSSAFVKFYCAAMVSHAPRVRNCSFLAWQSTPFKGLRTPVLTASWRTFGVIQAANAW